MGYHAYSTLCSTYSKQRGGRRRKRTRQQKGVVVVGVAVAVVALAAVARDSALGARTLHHWATITFFFLSAAGNPNLSSPYTHYTRLLLGMWKLSCADEFLAMVAAAADNSTTAATAEEAAQTATEQWARLFCNEPSSTNGSEVCGQFCNRSRIGGISLELRDGIKI